MSIAAAKLISERLLPALDRLAGAFEERRRPSGCHQIGRTHLMDATPLTLGQEFSGYAQQLRNNRERIDQTLPLLSQLAIGGTAVGAAWIRPKVSIRAWPLF